MSADSRSAPPAQDCTDDLHVWADEADAEGDTCNCGAWYRFKDRIDKTPKPDNG